MLVWYCSPIQSSDLNVFSLCLIVLIIRSSVRSCSVCAENMRPHKRGGRMNQIRSRIEAVRKDIYTYKYFYGSAVPAGVYTKAAQQGYFVPNILSPASPSPGTM